MRQGERRDEMAGASWARRLAERRGWGEYFSYDRNVYVLLLFTLGKGLQLSIGQVAINLYAYSLGYDKSFIGILTAMPAIGALLAAVPTGLLADRFGRRPLLLLSGFLNPLSLAGIAFSTDKTLLIVASVFNGFLSSAYWVTNLPFLTESTTDDQRVGVLALNNFLLLGVGALGAMIGGLVPELVSGVIGAPADSTVPLRFGVLAAAVVTFLPALPLLTLTEPKRASVTRDRRQRNTEAIAPPAVPEPAPAVAVGPAGPAETTAVREPAGMGRRAVARLFLQLLLPDMLFTTGEGAVVGLLQLYFFLRFGVQVGALGVVLTIAGLFGGATSLTAPRFVRRYGRLRIATTMQYLTAPVMLCIGFLPFFPLAALAEFGRQVLRGLFEPTYAAFAMERVSSRHRATLSGFYSVTWSIGYSIGPSLAGVLQDRVSLAAPFIIGAVCLVASATLLRLFFGRGENAPTVA